MELEWASIGRAALFLGIPFVILTYVLQWRWARTCKRNIWVLVAKAGGGGDWELAPKEGGQVTIRNPYNDEVKTWLINELATIEVLYPGVGFVPSFMQKSIRLAIVNEGDWEPLLNRSPHRKKVASPDVIEFMKEIGEAVKSQAPEVEASITGFLENMSTSPTREMIAPPEGLGNLMRMGVMRAMATVSDQLIEELKAIRTQLARFAGLNTTFVYMGLGLAVIMMGVVLFFVVQQANVSGAGDMADKVDQIYKSLGLGQ